MQWMSSLASVIEKAGKWVAGGAILEYFTNKGDGKGGAITNVARSAAETFVGEQSTVQGINASRDAIYQSMAKVNGFIGGGLAVLLDIIGKIFPPAAEWAEGCRNFALNQEKKMRNLNEEYQRGTTDVSLGEKINNIPGKFDGVAAAQPAVTAAGNVYNNVSGVAEGIIPDSIDGGNNHVAAIEAAVGTVLVAKNAGSIKTALSGFTNWFAGNKVPAAAAGEVAEHADDAVVRGGAAAEKGMLSKLFRGAGVRGNALVLGGLALGTGAVTLFSGGSTAEAAEDTAGALGYDETIDAAKAGNYEEAVHTGTVATTSLVGGVLGGAWAGAALGGATGSAFFGVGALPGAVVGGIGGAIVGSGIGSVVGEAAYSAGSWAVNGISSLFNSAASNTAPAASMPAPHITYNEPQWAAPIM